MTRSWLVLLVALLCSSVLAAESLRPARALFLNLGSLHPHRLFATYVIHNLFPTKHSELKSYKKDIKGLRPTEKTLVCQRGSRPRHPADLSLGTHWLVARNGTVKLSSKGTEKRRSSLELQAYVTASAPVISAQIANACARAARYSVAGR